MKKLLVVALVVIAMAVSVSPVAACGPQPPEGALGQVVAITDGAACESDSYLKGTVAWAFAVSQDGKWAATATGPSRWVSLTSGEWAQVAEGQLFLQPRLPGEIWVYTGVEKEAPVWTYEYRGSNRWHRPAKLYCEMVPAWQVKLISKGWLTPEDIGALAVTKVAPW